MAAEFAALDDCSVAVQVEVVRAAADGIVCYLGVAAHFERAVGEHAAAVDVGRIVLDGTARDGQRSVATVPYATTARRGVVAADGTAADGCRASVHHAAATGVTGAVLNLAAADTEVAAFSVVDAAAVTGRAAVNAAA